ncbi:MAG TPA: matrixin family metalloprotease, partial [Candidatus Nitrosocosmicus sp.]
MKNGILTYSFNDGNKKNINAVIKAINEWDKNLKGLEFKKTNSDGDIIISFTNDGKKVAGKTVNTIDTSGFIIKSYVTLSKKSFNRQFSSAEIEMVAKHEFGHVLGLNHANFNGNLMTSQV